MTLPNLNSLRMFEVSARHLNFRKAAEELNVTQGAVAQRIRQLEADLKIALFHRHARGISLTAAGDTYLRTVQKSLREIEGATDSLAQQRTVFKISLPPSFATKWFVPRLKKLADLFPDIEIQIVASEIKSNFKQDDVDLAIRIGAQPQEEGINIYKLAALNLVAVAAPDHPAAQQEMTLKRLGEFDLLQDGHAHWARIFGEAGINPKNRIFSFNQTALAMDAAVNGQGIVLAPYVLAKDDIAGNKLKIVWTEATANETGYYLVTPKYPKNDARTQDIVTWIKHEAQLT